MRLWVNVVLLEADERELSWRIYHWYAFRLQYNLDNAICIRIHFSDDVAMTMREHAAKY